MVRRLYLTAEDVHRPAVPLHGPTAEHEVHEGAKVAKKETKDVTLRPVEPRAARPSRSRRGEHKTLAPLRASCVHPFAIDFSVGLRPTLDGPSSSRHAAGVRLRAFLRVLRVFAAFA
jgi:hypothetical protein